jgi:hypothetical protein
MTTHSTHTVTASADVAVTAQTGPDAYRVGSFADGMTTIDRPVPRFSSFAEGQAYRPRRGDLG